MRLLLAAALALASTSGLGQDAPAAAVAIADLHAAAARKLKNDDCRSLGAPLCGYQHKDTATLEWSASCRQAAQWRNLGRNYQGDAELVGKYKDAVSFWDAYCVAHPEYQAAEDALDIGEAEETQAAEDTGEAEDALAAMREGALEGRFLLLLAQCLRENPDAMMSAELIGEFIEDEAKKFGAFMAMLANSCPEQTQALAEVMAEAWKAEAE